MGTFTKFLYDFLGQFFAGISIMLKGIWKGICELINIPAYTKVINNYKNDFSMPEWLLVGIAIGLIVLTIGLAVFLIIFTVRKYAKIRKKTIDQDAMLQEIASLNDKVVRLVKEKDEILAMKVSQLGLKPTDSPEESIEENTSEQEEKDNTNKDTRFAKLSTIDEQFVNYKIKDYGNNFTLPEFCEHFRNFAASRLHLYYTSDMMRLFISALASTKLVILQGISGTGKTSLAYAWGKFLKHDSCVASVQPSWRDRTELFGYFNEFTKKFNETEVLKEMYKAGYTDDVYTIILDEMNIARVEYYFAEMLSILEMPNKDEWVIEIVPSSWKTDPKKLKEGKLKIPPNMWYIGTINNDDSTFMVTDKVYDRAMPIDINDKGQVFEPIDMPPLDVNYSYLDKLFSKAMQEHPLSDDILAKIEQMDDYTIKHFRIALGNRIVAHMKKFVPVYVACGGDEIAGVDYFMAKKVLRKFEQLNISYIRDEILPYVEFLEKTFGKGKMKECIDYMMRLKKLT